MTNPNNKSYLDIIIFIISVKMPFIIEYKKYNISILGSIITLLIIYQMYTKRCDYNKIIFILLMLFIIYFMILMRVSEIQKMSKKN